MSGQDKTKGARGFTFLDIVCEIILGVLVAAMSLTCLLEVLFRYFLFIHVAGLDELMKMFFVWVCFLGAAVAVRRKAHFGVHLFVKAMPPVAQKGSELLSWVAIGVFGVILVITGTKATEIAFRQVFVGLGISYGWQYMLVPISGALICLHGIHGIIDSLKRSN